MLFLVLSLASGLEKAYQHFNVC